MALLPSIAPANPDRISAAFAPVLRLPMPPSWKPLWAARFCAAPRGLSSQPPALPQPEPNQNHDRTPLTYYPRNGGSSISGHSARQESGKKAEAQRRPASARREHDNPRRPLCYSARCDCRSRFPGRLALTRCRAQRGEAPERLRPKLF